jgi:hypothetical protein
MLFKILYLLKLAALPSIQREPGRFSAKKLCKKLQQAKLASPPPPPLQNVCKSGQNNIYKYISRARSLLDGILIPDF